MNSRGQNHKVGKTKQKHNYTSKQSQEHQCPLFFYEILAVCFLCIHTANNMLVHVQKTDNHNTLHIFITEWLLTADYLALRRCPFASILRFYWAATCFTSIGSTGSAGSIQNGLSTTAEFRKDILPYSFFPNIWIIMLTTAQTHGGIKYC